MTMFGLYILKEYKIILKYIYKKLQYQCQITMLDIQSITTKHGRDILQGREKLTPRNNKSGKLDKDIKTVVINIATYSKRRSIIIRGEKKTWGEGEQIKTLKK